MNRCDRYARGCRQATERGAIQGANGRESGRVRVAIEAGVRGVKQVTEARWHSAGLSELPDDVDWLAEAERDRFERMRYPKRRFDALLGRWTAKHCVAGVLGLGFDRETLADIVVMNASDGAPEVFISDEAIEWVIAMTDRADWGVATLMNGSERIGCDLELVEPRTDAFIEDYFTLAERSIVSKRDRNVAANLIWSAKESALKVLRTGLRRDTRTVEVDLGTDSERGWTSLRVTVDGETVLPGWWTRYGSFLLTFVSENEVPPPTSIHQPPAIAAGVPTHTWMDVI